MASKKSRTRQKRRDRRKAKQSGFRREPKMKPGIAGHGSAGTIAGSGYFVLKRRAKKKCVVDPRVSGKPLSERLTKGSAIDQEPQEERDTWVAVPFQGLVLNESSNAAKPQGASSGEGHFGDDRG